MLLSLDARKFVELSANLTWGENETRKAKTLPNPTPLHKNRAVAVALVGTSSQFRTRR